MGFLVELMDEILIWGRGGNMWQGTYCGWVGQEEDGFWINMDMDIKHEI